MFKEHKKKIITSIVAVGTVTLLLAGCTSLFSGSAVNTTDDQTLKITIPGEPMTIDPNKSIETNGAAVIDQTSEGIYRKDQNNKVAAGVVEKMVKPTENETKYTFTIRNNAKWANGEKITSQDFVTSIRRQADPKTKSQSLDALQYIENFDAVNSGKLATSKLGIHAINRRQFYVKLTKPISFMNYEFESFYPVNSKAIKKYGSKYGSSSSTVVANGAYVMKGWSGPNDSWTYVKNKNYWDAKNVKISKISVQVVKENNTAVNMFKSGKIDFTTVTGQYVTQEKDNKSLVVTKTGRNNYIYFNNKRKATSNESLRHAISLVINRQQLVEKVLQDGSAASTNIVPADYATNPSTGEDFIKEVGTLATTDTSKAKKYWKQAQKEIGKKNITLDFLVDDTDTEKQLAEYVQGAVSNSLKGLKINIVSVPHATHVTRDFANEYDIATVGWGPDYPDAQDFLDGMKSGDSINFSNFKDAQYDALMAKVANTTKYSAKERYDFEIQADKRLMQIAAVAPTYQASQAHLINTKLGGLKWDSMSGQSGKLQYAYWKK